MRDKKVNEKKVNENKSTKRPRATKYDQWEAEGVKDDMLDLMRGLASMGISRKIIAKECGITEATLIDYCRKYPDVKESLRRGSAHLFSETSNFLLDVMRNETVDINIRLGIASKMWSYERQRWDAIVENEEGAANGGNSTTGVVNIILKR